MKTRIITGLLFVACMILPTSTWATFPDVQSNTDYAEAISYVHAQQIIQGYSDGNFKPRRTLNRAEFVTILSRALFQPDETVGCQLFPDVPIDAWFTAHVCELFRRGLVEGYLSLIHI